MADHDSTRPYGYIYLVTNKINGKQYVGQTTMNVDLRFSKHCLKSQYRSRLSYAIEKYGKQNFVVETIDFAIDQHELDVLERIYIFAYQTTDQRNGYNVTKGGRGGVRTKEAAEKAAQKLRGRPLSVDHKEKIGAAKRGKKLSPEHIEKVRLSKVGFKHSDEARKKMSVAATGRKMPTFSEEHRARLSEAAKADWAKRKQLANCKE